MADLSNSTDAKKSKKPASSKSKPQSERRATKRLRIEVEIGLATETNFFNGYSEDLSDGGLFIATYQALKVKTLLELWINLPECDTIMAHGRVVWVREALEGVPAGVGVAFEKLEDADRKKILEFVSVRAPIFYDL